MIHIFLFHMLYFECKKGMYSHSTSMPRARTWAGTAASAAAWALRVGAATGARAAATARVGPPTWTGTRPGSTTWTRPWTRVAKRITITQNIWIYPQNDNDAPQKRPLLTCQTHLETLELHDCDMYHLRRCELNSTNCKLCVMADHINTIRKK